MNSEEIRIGEPYIDGDRVALDITGIGAETVTVRMTSEESEHLSGGLMMVNGTMKSIRARARARDAKDRIASKFGRKST